MFLLFIKNKKYLMNGFIYLILDFIDLSILNSILISLCEYNLCIKVAHLIQEDIELKNKGIII